jgi:hypothetical protein
MLNAALLLTGWVSSFATQPGAPFDPQGHLFGDPWQLRSTLGQAGVSLQFREQSEIFRAVSVGLNGGTAYVGGLTFGMMAATNPLGL